MIFDVIAYIALVLVFISTAAYIMFTVKLKKNPNLSITVRKAVNWFYPFFIAVSIVPLSSIGKYENNLIFDLIISFVFYLCFAVVIFITYSGKWKFINEQERKGMVSICPRSDYPSEFQKREAENYSKLSKIEQEKWYGNYCKENKYINPYLAVAIHSLLYFTLLFFIVKQL